MADTDPCCLLCSRDYPAEFVETITSASAAIGDEMSPEAFREWLMDDTRDPGS
jgi:hypothetical protein